MRDIFSGLDFKMAIAPVAARTDNTAIVSSILDLQGCEGACFALQLGTNTDANATFTVLAEESDDAAMAGQNAIADDELNGTEALAGFTFADDTEVRKLGIRNSKRYVRVTVTPAGNDSGNIFLSAQWVVARNLQPHLNPGL